MGTADYPTVGVLGIAAPICNNSVKLTNLHWPQADGDDVAQVLQMQRLVFLNDFVVGGFGLVSGIKEGVDYSRLNLNPVDPNGTIAMIGAGTGLGNGFLTKAPGAEYYHVFPSEGGHQNFPAQTELQWNYVKYLMKIYDIERAGL